MESRKREAIVKELISISSAFSSTLKRDSSVFSRQETMSDHSLWLPLQGWKRMRDKYRPGYVAPIEKIDVGTDFVTWKQEYENSHDSVVLSRVISDNERYFFSGPVRAIGSAGVVNNSDSRWPLRDNFFSVERRSYLNGLGTTAIARCIPTNPHADLAVSLAELRKDGLPKLTGMQLKKGGRNSPNLAGDYLNQQFGWNPIARDLRSLANVVVAGSALVRQFERDSGKNVRRSYYFPEKVTETTESLGTGQAIGYFPSTRLFAGGSSVIQGPLTLTKRKVEKAWFKGAFTYISWSDEAKANQSRAMLGELQKARHLLGLRIDAEVAYNYTGFSWLADWFVNLGDVIHNLVAFGSDGLVMRYGYLMCTTTYENTYTVTTPLFGPVSTTYRTIEKARLHATPFGFGLKSEDLTPQQMAILAALGLSQRPRR